MNIMRRRTSWAVIGSVCCAGAATLLGCGGDDAFDSTGSSDAGSDATTSSADSSLPDAGARDSSSLDTGAADGRANDGGDAGELLTDDQIVQVLHTANQGEVTEGTLAEGQAVTATIQAVATEFVQMHSMADSLLLSTAGDAGLAGAPSSTATALQAQAAADATALAAASGVSFDELYYADQLHTHQVVLALIDDLLLTQVQSPVLKLQVQAAQTMVAMHLQELEALQQGDAGTFDAGDAGDSGP